MCNHYRMKYDMEVLEFASHWARDDIFDEEFMRTQPGMADLVGDVTPWAKTRMPIVYAIEGGNVLNFIRWGVWPFYAKTMPKPPIANARDDQLLKSAAWKQSAATRRCLVPADGFFEWAGPKGAKWEVLFHLPDERPFFFAGIWSHDPADGARGFAIVTTSPNPMLAALPHDRMPVILDEDVAREWIGREPLPPDDLLALCRPYEGELVRVDQPRPAPRPGKITRDDLAGGELSLE